MTGAEPYPEDVDDGRDTPPDLSSDAELGLEPNDLALSECLERPEIPEDEVALVYELLDALEEHVDDGDVHPDSAAGHLEAFAWKAQEAQGIPDELVLRERFDVDVDDVAFVGREASRLDQWRAKLARVIRP